MVLLQRLNYGFNGYQVPTTPRAARSARRSAFKKNDGDNQTSSFDLLAAVAGNLLLEGGNSSSSSNNTLVNGDQCALSQSHVKKELLDEDQTVREGTCARDDAQQSFFVSEILSEAHQMQSFTRSLSPHKDSNLGTTSVITFSDSSERFGVRESTMGSKNQSVGPDGDLDNSERNDKESTAVGDRRIKKVLASKHCTVSLKPEDATTTNSNLDLKPGYSSRKSYFRSLRSERNYPIKKRRYFDCFQSSSQSEETTKNEETIKKEDLCGSPKQGSAFSSSVADQKPRFQSRDSQVKLRIKSFRVPELFIEIPETATVGSLKRMVLEAVNAVLGGGLRVGVLVQGKKVRDDNKMLLQTGISLDTLSDALDFCLEPSQSSEPLCHPQDSNLLLPCNPPQPLTRRNKYVESDNDYKPSAPKATSGRTTYEYSRALLPVPSLRAEEAITVIPPRKTKRCEVPQRRIRRPFSVAEVDALVQAVEKLGTGRWRDVKLRAFDNAKHRTYVDLKDKWKTLVHTARISPQQRRGEPVPQELLDRVLTAHAYWSHQQGKHHHALETHLGL